MRSVAQPEGQQDDVTWILTCGGSSMWRDWPVPGSVVGSTPAAPIFPQKLFGRLLRACAPSPRAPDKLHTCVKQTAQPAHASSWVSPSPHLYAQQGGAGSGRTRPMQRAAAVLLCLCAATAVQGRRQVRWRRQRGREGAKGRGGLLLQAPANNCLAVQASGGTVWVTATQRCAPPAARTTLPPRSSSSLPRPRHPTAAPAQLPLTMAAAAAGAAPLGRNILCAWRGWTS